MSASAPITRNLLTTREVDELRALMATVGQYGDFDLAQYDYTVKALWVAHVQAKSAKLSRKRKAKPDQDKTFTERLIWFIDRVVQRTGAAKARDVLEAVRGLVQQCLEAPPPAPHATTSSNGDHLRKRSDTAETMFRRQSQPATSSPPQKRQRRARGPPAGLIPSLLLVAQSGALSLSNSLRLCSVSNEIRETLLNEPAAWQHISGLTRTGVHALASILDLNNKPFSIDVDFASADDASTVMAALHDHTIRITRLSFRSDVDMGDADEQFRIFFQQRSSKLTALSLRFRGVPEVLDTTFLYRSKVRVLVCRASQLASRLSSPTVESLTLVGPDDATRKGSPADASHPARFLGMFPSLSTLVVEDGLVHYSSSRAPHALDILHCQSSAMSPDMLNIYMNDIQGPQIRVLVLHGQHPEYIDLALEHLPALASVDYIAYGEKVDLYLSASNMRRRLIADADPCLSRDLVTSFHDYLNLERLGLSQYLKAHQILAFHRSLPCALKVLEIFVDSRMRSDSVINMLQFDPRRTWKLPPTLELLRLTGKPAFAPELHDEDEADQCDVLRVMPKISAQDILTFLWDHLQELAGHLTVEIDAAEVEEGLAHEDVHLLSTRVKALIVNGKLIDPLRNR